MFSLRTILKQYEIFISFSGCVHFSFGIYVYLCFRCKQNRIYVKIYVNFKVSLKCSTLFSWFLIHFVTYISNIYLNELTNTICTAIMYYYWFLKCICFIKGEKGWELSGDYFKCFSNVYNVLTWNFGWKQQQSQIQNGPVMYIRSLPSRSQTLKHDRMMLHLKN